MVKLDVNVLRYMSKEEFRVLTAVEMGMKNHEVVPVPLIENVAGLRGGGAYKLLSILLRNKLVHHENKKYDGYFLTYAGYDYLSLKALSKRGHIAGLGQQIGVGKESDIYVGVGDDGTELALKLHRLGRTSFRTIKNNRDYLKHRNSASWLYFSRLAALKEFAFLKALHDKGFPVPTPVDCNRHAVLMHRVDAVPLYQVSELRHPQRVYDECMNLICRLARYGLIHCDFNEYNLLIRDDESLIMIDFPQMVSTSHRNAPMYFERDVECVRRFFIRKFGFHGCEAPQLSDVVREHELDVALAASGFTRDLDAVLMQAVEEARESNAAEADNAAADDTDGDLDSADDDEEEAEDEREDEDGAEGTQGRAEGGNQSTSATTGGSENQLCCPAPRDSGAPEVAQGSEGREVPAGGVVVDAREAAEQDDNSDREEEESDEEGETGHRPQDKGLREGTSGRGRARGWSRRIPTSEDVTDRVRKQLDISGRGRSQAHAVASSRNKTKNRDKRKVREMAKVG